jgi:hypothetical protein
MVIYEFSGYNKVSFGKIFQFLLAIVLFNFTLIKSYAVGDNPPLGARYAGMGGISTVVPDVFSVWHNQAGLAEVKNVSAGVIYQNDFMVKELQLSAFSFAIPTLTGTLAAGYSVFGYSKYNESRLGLAFGKPFGKKLSVGVQVNYHNIYIAEGYGNKGTVTVEGGILSKPIDNLTLGVSLFNPTRQKITDDGYERLPTLMKAGIGYQVSTNAFLCFETEKQLDYKAINRFGMEYKVPENFWLRTGVAVNPCFFSFGMGYAIKKLKFDLAFTRHYILGYSPHISLDYKF